MANRTYADLITSSLRLLGVKAQGQRATGAEAVDALAVLNELIDSWNTNLGMLFGTTQVVIPITGASTYLVGPSGSTSGQRPTKLIGAWHRSGTTDTELEVLVNSDYGGVRDKSYGADVPSAVFLDATMPSATLYVYPVATSGSIVLQYSTPLREVELTTIEGLPPAYRKAIRYNLAVDLAPEYGIEAPPSIQRNAVAMKSMIMNANAVVPRMSFGDLALFNINTGA